MIRIITIVSLFLAFVNQVNATINFENGRWDTTFDCTEATVFNTINCDGMRIWLEQVASDPNEFSKIESAANNPLGSGRGFSRINGWGDSGFGGGVEDNSASIGGTFPSPQKELWIRYYIKYPINWAASPFIADKYIYVSAYGNLVQAIVEPNSIGFRMLCQGLGTTTGNNAQSTYTVSNMFGGSYVGDGQWHCIETHIKMDTNGVYGGSVADGIAQIWVDGIIRVNSSTINYSHGDTPSKTGFINFTLNLNQNKMVQVDEYLARVYVDDIVVYNITPPNTDDYGNPYIGPIITGHNPPSINAGSDKIVYTTTAQIIGTATADLGVTITGVTCAGQTVTPDDGTWDEQNEAWTCNVTGLVLGLNVLEFIATQSDDQTGSDSVTVTRIKKTSKINGSATIKNATIHQ